MCGPKRARNHTRMANMQAKYPMDDAFKAAARQHQSQYRRNVLQVAYDEHENRLMDAEAMAFLNYYDDLNVRTVLRARYPFFSKVRDANMLRSEHIPFNLFALLSKDGCLAKEIIRNAFGIEVYEVVDIQFEFAPDPKALYLNDGTAFDTFIRIQDQYGKIVGIGIEVKYTEKGYPIGKTEKANVDNSHSKYWEVTRNSKAFLDHACTDLSCDELRQIWRNHILGLSMCQRGEIDDFYSITLYPAGNHHFDKVIPRYQSLLTESSRDKVLGCTYETFIQSINGNDEVLRWRQYLVSRYIVPDNIALSDMP